MCYSISKCLDFDPIMAMKITFPNSSVAAVLLTCSVTRSITLFRSLKIDNIDRIQHRNFLQIYEMYVFQDAVYAIYKYVDLNLWDVLQI
jgi:hypothetical protein